MSKINWTLRFKNKTTLVALLAAVVAFVYQLAAVFGVTPPVTQDAVTQAVMLVVNILAALGIVVDPTTSGIADSAQAMGYDEPKED